MVGSANVKAERCRTCWSRQQGTTSATVVREGRCHVELASLLTLLLMALFLAVQPWSVLAAILLVTAQDGMKKEIAYVGGWVTALLAVAVTTVLVYPDIPQGSTSNNSQAAVELGVGILFGGWLLWRWRNPKDATTRSNPLGWRVWTPCRRWWRSRSALFCPATSLLSPPSARWSRA